MGRDTGKPVEGHVEAETVDEALTALSESGIVTESLRENPRAALPIGKNLEGPPEFVSAIDSALDSSASQIEFDDLTEKFRGKRVWVIDRDKIRSRVAQVVDRALAQSAQEAETANETRERVAEAIKDMFRDNRNLTSPAPQVAAGAAAPSHSSPMLEQQISRLSRLISQAESVLASIAAAARRVGSGGGGFAPRRYGAHPQGEEQNKVLMEIFKSNVELLRTVEEGLTDATAPPTSDGGDNGAPDAAPPPGGNAPGNGNPPPAPE